MGNEWFFYMIPPSCAEICGIKVTPYWGVTMMPWDFYDTYAKEDKRLGGIADRYIGTDGTLYSREGSEESTKSNICYRRNRRKLEIFRWWFAVMQMSSFR